MSSHLEPPGPRGLGRVAHAYRLVRNTLPTLTRDHARYGDVVGYRIGPVRLWSVTDPDAAHHVLVSNAKHYRKSPSYRALAMVLGQGLVTSEGALWKRQRKLSQPAFHHRAVQGLTDTMAACAEDLLAEWDALGDGASLDAHSAMMGVTMRIVGRTLFGAELGPDRDRVYEAISIALHRANRSVAQLFLVPTWLPTAENRRYQAAMRTLDGIVYRIIESRRSEAEPRPDLLGMLMAARDDDGDGDGMSDRQLRDEIMTLFVAGHETVANALSWAWVCLSRHPDVEARLVDEVRTVLQGRTPGFEDVAALTYTGRVLDEVMRLYPPAWMVERQALADDVIGGRPLPKYSLVAVPTYLLHRHRDHWEDPERFDPDRFEPERVAARHRHAYLPFGAGPRICIGNMFAKVEATILLAALVQRWRLVVPRRVFGLDAGITLRPAGGVPAVLEARGDVPAQRRAVGT